MSSVLVDLEGRALPTAAERALAASRQLEAETFARVGLTYGREPDPEWQEALDRIAERSEMLSSLVIWWEPGDAWEPVQRWIIYNLIPPRAIPPRVFEQLGGVHPRSSGHPCVGRVGGHTYCMCRKPRGRWVDGPAPLITRTAWEIFQRFGGWARPYYVVQGSAGGHRYKWHPWEAKLSQMVGGPPDTPAPGDLPYAEPDLRTWAAIKKADLALKHRMTLTAIAGGVVAADLEATEAAKHCAAELLRWMGDQCEAHAGELSSALAKDSSTPRIAPFLTREDRARLEARYDPDRVAAEVSAELVADMTGGNVRDI